MRLHRFYVPIAIDENKRELDVHSADLVNQIRRVFRLKVGDEIIIFNGRGIDYVCKIAELKEENIICVLDMARSKRSRFQPARKIILAAAIVKKDNFEWIVEKATELGVSKIIPVLAERSEKKNVNEERLKKIAIEASEQSGRANIPEIFDIKNLEEVLSSPLDSNLKRVAFHTEGEVLLRSDLSKTKPIEIFIGPEGGWSQSEIELFHKYNVPVKSIGSQILRSETAVVAILSQIIF